jgi:integrase
VWLSAVLGARRGEVVALQWEDLDLAAGVVRLDENYVRASDGMILKDTKSHQMRRVSIDAPTVDLLPAAGRQRCLPTLRSRERGYRWSSTP